MMRLKSTLLGAKTSEVSSKPKSLSLSLDPSKSARKDAFKKERQKLDAARSSRKPGGPSQVRNQKMRPVPQHKVNRLPVPPKNKLRTNKQPRSARTPSKTSIGKQKENKEVRLRDSKLKRPSEPTAQNAKECIADSRQDDTAEPRNNDSLVDGRDNDQEFPVQIGPYEELLACSGSDRFTEQQLHYEDLKSRTVPSIANAASDLCRMSCLDNFPLNDQILINQAVQDAKSFASDKSENKEESIASKYQEDPVLESIPLKNLAFEDKTSFFEHIENANEGLKSILLGQVGCNAREFVDFLTDWDGGSSNSLTSSGSLETGFKTRDTGASSYILASEDSKDDFEMEEEDRSRHIASSGSSSTIETEILRASDEDVGEWEEVQVTDGSKQSSLVQHTIRDLRCNEDEIQHFEVTLSTSSLSRIEEGSTTTTVSKPSKQETGSEPESKPIGSKSNDDDKPKTPAASPKTMLHMPKPESTEEAKLDRMAVEANAEEVTSLMLSLGSLKLSGTSLLDKKMAESVADLTLQEMSEEIQSVQPEGGVFSGRSAKSINTEASLAQPTDDSAELNSQDLIEKNVSDNLNDANLDYIKSGSAAETTGNALGLSDKELKRTEKRAFDISLKPLKEFKQGHLRNSYSTGGKLLNRTVENESCTRAPISPLKVEGITSSFCVATEPPAFHMLSNASTDTEDGKKREVVTQFAQNLDWDAFLASGIQSKSMVLVPPTTIVEAVPSEKKSEVTSVMPSKISLVKSFLCKAKKK